MTGVQTCALPISNQKAVRYIFYWSVGIIATLGLTAVFKGLGPEALISLCVAGTVALISGVGIREDLCSRLRSRLVIFSE